LLIEMEGPRVEGGKITFTRGLMVFWMETTSGFL